MSEILPCAVCGMDDVRVVPLVVQDEDQAVCPNCGLRASSAFGVPQATKNWNTLMRHIADGRAVEKLQKQAVSPDTVAEVTFFSDWVDYRDGRDGVNVSFNVDAPTLAEAVRKAQGDE